MNAARDYSNAEILEILDSVHSIAMVGASTNWKRPSYFAMKYLQAKGYRIIPVNPGRDLIFGEKAYATLLDIPWQVDVVDVFRPAEETPAIAANAVEIGAKVLWLQLGIISEEAAEIATEGGLTVVMDHCMGAMHAKLGLGPGPDH